MTDVKLKPKTHKQHGFRRVADSTFREDILRELHHRTSTVDCESQIFFQWVIEVSSGLPDYSNGSYFTSHYVSGHRYHNLNYLLHNVSYDYAK